MKGQFLKKIAAVGTGLALVAGSVVAAVNWSDMVDETNKTMKVSGIVVGANADPMDSTAANALAAALASKYTYDKMTEVTEQVPIEGTAGLDDSKAYTYKKDSTGSNWGVAVSVSNTRLSSLVDEVKNQKINGTTYSNAIKETISFGTGVQPSYSTDRAVQDLVLPVSSGKLIYTVDLGTDLNFDYTTSWNDGSRDYVQLPFLGEWYILNQIKSDDEISLVRTSAPATYEVGQTLTVDGKDGKQYTIEIKDGFTGSDNNNYITLELYDSSNKFLEAEDFSDGEEVEFYVDGEVIVEDAIYVDTVQKRTQASSDVFTVRMRTGAGRVVLKDGRCYPNYTESNEDKCDWVASVDIGFDVLKSYGLKNSSSYKFTGKDALVPGQSMVFPNNFAAVKFVGLTLPEFDSSYNRDVYEVTVGDSISGATAGSSNGLSFVSSSDVSHEVPFYYDLGYFSWEKDENTYGSKAITLDGRTQFLAFNDDNGTLGVYHSLGTYDSSKKETTYTYDYAIGDIIPIEGKDSRDFNYMLVADVNENYTYKLWLVLAQQEIPLRYGTLTFVGTALPNGTAETLDENFADSNYFSPVYVPKHDDFLMTLGVTGSGSYDLNQDVIDESDGFFLALVDVENDLDNTTTRVLVDTYTDMVTDEDDSDNSANYAMFADATVDGDYKATAGVSLLMKDGRLKKYVSDNGVVSELVDDKYASILIPDRSAEYLVKFYDKTGVTGEATYKTVTTTKPVKTPYAGMPTVMTDVAAGAGNYIVVGGYVVNDLFAKVAADAETAAEKFGEALAEAGDKVTKVIDGSLYVAGYTKKDTMDAVEALIDELNL